MKRKISLILITSLLYFISCSKEYSREDIYTPPVIVDTVPNPLIFKADIFIASNKDAKIIYVSVVTKLWPGHYWLFDSILINRSSISTRYVEEFDVSTYLDMTKYKKGDVFIMRSEVRWRFTPSTYHNDTTIIY